MNEMLILTFGGVKGTVSLATIFILPTAINGEHFKNDRYYYLLRLVLFW